MRPAARTMTVIAGVMLASGIAHADSWEDLQGAGSLEYEASYVQRFEPRDATSTGVDGWGLAGARLRGQMGGKHLEYRIGLDLHAGATYPGGFAYDVDLYAFGLGLKMGRWSRFGITSGVGASGATGTVDDAVQLPVEACLELALGPRLRVLSRARVTWLVGADGRERGAPSLPAGDELEASFALRIGHRWTDYDFPAGNGYYVGIAYREAEDTKMVGLVIGHSIDAASR
jgi:hypothetical protein